MGTAGFWLRLFGRSSRNQREFWCHSEERNSHSYYSMPQANLESNDHMHQCRALCAECTSNSTNASVDLCTPITVLLGERLHNCRGTCCGLHLCLSPHHDCVPLLLRSRHMAMLLQLELLWRGAVLPRPLMDCSRGRWLVVSIEVYLSHFVFSSFHGGSLL